MNPDDPEVPFAFWRDPESTVTISYSLPVFHEIDFQVNEGYRRIAHGGVEVGGLLYGRVTPGTISIEAFRAIECEHASGPSFNLSERDLENLSQSILNAPHEEDLQGMLPLGWFISHTRGPLRMSDRELQLFQRFFPEPLRLTILVKPERFKPTRFTFLLRQASGKINPDGEANAIILPLPGRPGKAGSVPTAAIPAPAEALETPTADAGSRSRSSSDSLKIVPRQSETSEVRPQPTATPTPLAAETQTTSPLPREKPAALPIDAPQTSQESIPITTQAPSIPAAAAIRSRTDRNGSSAKANRPWRLLLILALAALLGCAGGYWAYLQLPPPVISLRVQKRTSDLLVLWNPIQTRSSNYAVIRINDSRPVLLTEEQKISGVAQVPLSGESVKVEIVAPHWVRESRGIIRFVPAQPAPGAGQVAQ